MFQSNETRQADPIRDLQKARSAVHRGLITMSAGAKEHPRPAQESAGGCEEEGGGTQTGLVSSFGGKVQILAQIFQIKHLSSDNHGLRFCFHLRKSGSIRGN